MGIVLSGAHNCESGPLRPVLREVVGCLFLIVVVECKPPSCLPSETHCTHGHKLPTLSPEPQSPTLDLEPAPRAPDRQAITPPARPRVFRDSESARRVYLPRPRAQHHTPPPPRRHPLLPCKRSPRLIQRWRRPCSPSSPRFLILWAWGGSSPNV
jgi:hypothetical protein